MSKNQQSNQNMGTALKPIEIMKIKQIIGGHEWPKKLWGKSIFERVAEMVTHLKKEEKKLVLNLLKDYNIIGNFQYIPCIKYAIQLIDDSFLKDKKSLFMMPLIKEEDMGRVKSGNSILYEIKGVIERNEFFASHCDPVLYSRLDTFAQKQEERSNALIVLCDDFVGSGTTAECAIDYFESHYSIDSDQIIVFCLITLKQGLKRIRNKGYEVVFYNVFSKGISESKRFGDSDLDRMDEIESKIGVSEEYERGYKGSEGLVTLKRTPNNTFPVFWYDGQSNWPAAFPR